MNFLHIFVDIEIFKFLILETLEINFFFFYLIGETQTMSILKTEPLDQIFNPKFFITSEKKDFINQL